MPTVSEIRCSLPVVGSPCTIHSVRAEAMMRVESRLGISAVGSGPTSALRLNWNATARAALLTFWP